MKCGNAAGSGCGRESECSLTPKLSDVRRVKRLSARRANDEPATLERRSGAHVRWSALVRPHHRITHIRQCCGRYNRCDPVVDHGRLWADAPPKQINEVADKLATTCKIAGGNNRANDCRRRREHPAPRLGGAMLKEPPNTMLIRELDVRAWLSRCETVLQLGDGLRNDAVHLAKEVCVFIAPCAGKKCATGAGDKCGVIGRTEMEKGSNSRACCPNQWFG